LCAGLKGGKRKSILQNSSELSCSHLLVVVRQQFPVESQGFLGVFGIAAVFGLSIVAMAYSIGNVSGCHINPAVSLAMLVSKKMSVKDFAGYVIFQILGGIAAAGLLKLIGGICDPVITGLGTNGYGDASFVGLNMVGAIIVEVVLTFIFLMAILGVTSEEKYSSVAGLVIAGEVIREISKI
jgi:aquaporin Z